MVYGINQNLNLGLQEQAMAAQGAMIVSGLEKELGASKIKINLNDNKVNLKELEEYIQKLNNASSLEEIRKFDEKKRREQKKKEELARGKKFPLSETPINSASPFEWIKNARPGGFFSLLLDLERQILREVLKFVLQPNLDELIGLAKDLDLDAAAWKLDKINIDCKGNILLAGDLSPEEKLRILLLDECKILMIGRLLEDSWLKKAVIAFRLFRVRSTLKELGIEKVEFERIEQAAKRIAFLKLVAALKDNHLKRVFSASRREFILYSRSIGKYTKKIKRIDVDIPSNGMLWINQKLETLALEAARYKLELLRSMEKLSHDPEREKTIRWLEHA